MPSPETQLPACPAGQCDPGARDLDDHVTAVSPPIVGAPIYTCGSVVQVSGVIPGASVEVTISWPGGSATTPPVTAAHSDGVTVDVTSVLGRTFLPGDVVAASQSWGLATELSEPVPILELPEFEGGAPPAPRVAPAPYYRCGHAVGGAEIVPGAYYSAHMQDSVAGECFMGVVASPGTSVRFWGAHLDVCPSGNEDPGVFARQEVCGVLSPDSEFMPIVDPPPSPIAPPEFVGDLYAGQTALAASRAHFGAAVTITVDGTPEGLLFPVYGDFTDVLHYPLSAALPEGAVVSISQQFCEGEQPTRTTVVRSCDEMPAPQIQAPGIGDRHVDVLVSVPDTRMLVFANGVEIGDGGGRRVMLQRPIQAGDTIMVVQETTAGCRANEMHVTAPACIPHQRLADPTFAGRSKSGRPATILSPSRSQNSVTSGCEARSGSPSTLLAARAAYPRGVARCRSS